LFLQRNLNCGAPLRGDAAAYTFVPLECALQGFFAFGGDGVGMSIDGQGGQ